MSDDEWNIAYYRTLPELFRRFKFDEIVRMAIKLKTENRRRIDEVESEFLESIRAVVDNPETDVHDFVIEKNEIYNIISNVDFAMPRLRIPEECIDLFHTRAIFYAFILAYFADESEGRCDAKVYYSFIKRRGAKLGMDRAEVVVIFLHGLVYLMLIRFGAPAKHHAIETSRLLHSRAADVFKSGSGETMVADLMATRLPQFIYPQLLESAFTTQDDLDMALTEGIVAIDYMLKHGDLLVYKIVHIYDFVTLSNPMIEPDSAIGLLIYFKQFTLEHMLLVLEDVEKHQVRGFAAGANKRIRLMKK